MMSTLSGLLAGLLLAALVTVMYGQQVSTSLRHAIDKHLAVTDQPDYAPTQNPEVVAGAVASVGSGVPNKQTQHELGPDQVDAASSAEPVELGKGQVATTALAHPVKAEPDEAGKPGLEQLWFDYAKRADTLSPVGTFPWQRCFARAAASHDVPLALLLAIASGESDFDSAALSDKNAIGLMQIRWPLTSRHLGVVRQADLYDPCTNVDAGARYLVELSQQYADNLHLMVAAYNYGPSRIAPGQVPEGALWYSHYIYQHLQQVLGGEPSATSELIGSPTRPDAGREVLMTFNRAHRARDFIAFLSARVPGLNLQQQSESLGRHDVVLLYSDQADKLRAMQAMSEAGLESLGQKSNSTYQL